MNKELENKINKLKDLKKSIGEYEKLQDSLYEEAKTLFKDPNDEWIFEYLFNFNIDRDSEIDEYANLVMEKIYNNIKVE
jgi:hypothetical protein